MQEAIIASAKILKANIANRPFPTHLIYPGLSSKPIYDKSSFTFASLVEQNFAIIKDEFMKGREVYKINDYDPKNDKVQLQGKMQWLNLIKRGQQKDEFKRMFPKTSKIIESIPEFVSGIPFSNALFSTLFPETSISKGYGPCNAILKCAIPIITNEDCFMRIAGNPKQLKMGKIIIYDDTYEHEEANLHEKEESVTFVFNVWHPELSKEEISSLRMCMKKLEMQMADMKKAKK